MLQIFPSTSRTHSLPSTTVTGCSVSVTTFSKSDGSDWRAKPFSHMSASGYASLSTDVVVNVKKTGWVGLTVLVGRVTNEVFGLVPSSSRAGAHDASLRHRELPHWHAAVGMPTDAVHVDTDNRLWCIRMFFTCGQATAAACSALQSNTLVPHILRVGYRLTNLCSFVCACHVTRGLIVTHGLEWSARRTSSSVLVTHWSLRLIVCLFCVPEDFVLGRTIDCPRSYAVELRWKEEKTRRLTPQKSELPNNLWTTSHPACAVEWVSGPFGSVPYSVVE